MTSIGHAVSAALIQFLWQGAIVALLYGILETVLRSRPPHARYLAGCAALSVLALMPVVTAGVLYRPSLPEGANRPVTDWTLPLWCLGVLISAIRPLVSLARIRGLRRRATQPEAWIAELAAGVAARIQCVRVFRILICTYGETPCAIGWLKPVILVPAATIAGLTVEQLETILAHEIAHIRRHDYLINILQIAVETLFFYHPAVWWISSRIRFERELCCDDEAVRAAEDPLTYARALTTLERLRSAAPVPALGSTGGHLSYRIRRLVGEPQSAPHRWPALAAVALSLAFLTLGVRWVNAQDAEDKVTVEVTRDQQGSITSVRVLSGPEYLRPLALSAALQQPVQPGPMTLPPERRVRTFVFPDAFGTMSNQASTLDQFFEDQLREAERTLDPVVLADLRRKVAAARWQSYNRQRSQSMWKVQTLRHQLAALKDGDSRYAATHQALAAAETELANSAVP